MGAPHDIVIRAVPGRRVHQPGAGFEGRVAGEVQPVFAAAAFRHTLRPERGRVDGRVVSIVEARKGILGNRHPRRGRAIEATGRQERFRQAARDHQVFDHAAARDRQRDVLQLRVGHDRQVCRQGPRRGGPYHQSRRFAAELGQRGAQPGHQRQAHVDRRRRVIGVLDFSLGQSRVVNQAPVHGLLVAVDEARARESGQLSDDGRLVPLRERQIRVIPQPEAPQALELAAHDVHEFQGVGLAAHTKFRRPEFGFRLSAAELLFHLLFDGQTVTIPAGAKHGAAPHEQLRAHHDVFENLVEDGAVVNPAGRVGRPIVQHERGRFLTRAGGQNALVLSVVGPARQPFRFASRQIGPHREVRLRQIQGRFPIHGAADTTKCTGARSGTCPC